MTPSVSPTAGIRIGTVLDRYEIVRHVARGGMGSVWLGRMTGKHGFTKQVAIKTIAPEYAENPQFHAMFLEEARISSKLVHTNVAQVLDVGEHNAGVYIVFEWVDGQPLSQICSTCESAGKRMPVAVLLRVLADACAGLHAVHELADENGQPLGVVHRDVTPGNVLVSDAGFAKVIDFGIAKARDRVHIQTRAGYVKGTPEYMSPEQASKESVDRRADVWSLGAVLFRGLAGAPPFRDREALVAYMDGRSKLPPLPADVPNDVQAIVARALEVNRMARYATAEEMRAALERALHAGEMTSADVAQQTSRLVATAREAVAGAHAPTELANPSVVPPPGSAAATVPATRATPPPPPRVSAGAIPQTLISASVRPEPLAPPPKANRALPVTVVAVVLALAGVALAFARCGAH